MPEAVELVDELREEIRELEAWIFEHPYLDALESGEVSRGDLGVFAGQQYRIIPSDLRSIGVLISRYGAGPTGELFRASLQTEVEALAGLLAFAGALGLSEADLEAVEPLPGALAYTHFVSWLALYGSDAEFAASFLVNLPAWGRNCGRMARALQEEYGMRPEDVAFFRLFAEGSAEFEEGALQVIEAGLKRGVPPQAIKRAAHLLQEYELMFWDSVTPE